MRVAAISDLHGNLPALEAVLDEVQAEDVDELIVAGDILPGPMPRESLSALEDAPLPVRFLMGNGERDGLRALRGEELTRVPAEFREVVRWSAAALSSEQIAEVGSWPLTLRRDIPGIGSVLFCHATPRDDNELFTRLTPEDRLRPIFEAAGAALVVCGHTHMQFDRRIGRVRVINLGSVGMPFGDPGAYWAILGPGVELRHTSYDLDAAAERIAATEYPQVELFDVRQPAPEAEMLRLFEAAALR